MLFKTDSYLIGVEGIGEAIAAAIQRQVVPLIRELMARPTGTSLIATPEDIRARRIPVPPGEPDRADNARLADNVRLRREQALRYGRLFRNFIPNCAFTSREFLVRDEDRHNIYTCNLYPNEVKNAYIALRMYCHDDVNEFRDYVRANDGVPDFGDMGTP